MAVAELFLSPLLQVLFEKLVSGVLKQFARQEGILSMLKKWTNMLSMIQAVIHDAEDKQITHEPTKLWLESLMNLAYDLDDIVDEMTTEALRRNLMEPKPNRSKVSKFVHGCFNFSPREIRSNSKMMSKIKNVTMKFDEIIKQKNDLNLNVVDIGSGISNRTDKRLPTTSLVNESLVYGREREREQILKMLLSKEEYQDDVCVIPIVGMGGIGKTTLAQLVYNDEDVKTSFDLKAWVCVTEEFDVLTISRIIYESVMQRSGDSKALNLLQEDLKEKLSKSKFLLILDDVWNEEYEKWDLLSRPFQVGLPGSKVIVTTRISGVASLVGSVPAYLLSQLTNDDCLCLLAQHALGRKNFDAHPDLKGIGEDLARKCGGLPLAAKALGGILRSKFHPDEWEEVLTSKIWNLPKESNILPVLRLSYHHLPSGLKQLFAYCSIFPKDYEFDKRELVLLWMGEGFLQLPQGREKKRVEEFGFECFNELESRSFFQRLSGHGLHFVMHDLINDLAQFVAGKTCYRLDEKADIYEWQKISENTRHSSFLRHEYEVFKKFQALDQVRGLRTYLPMPVQNSHVWPPFYLSNRILHNLLPELSCLRVLSLSGYSVSELPSSICNLIHLRYLNLSGTSIVSLPESLSNLYNLQTLSIRNCRFIRRLPETVGDLVNLRHLDNTNTDHLNEMPVGIGKLTNLQSLPKIVVGNGCGFGLSDLQNLLQLRGILSLVELQNVEDVQEAKEAKLMDKNIEELQLTWSDNPHSSRDEDLEQDVLDMLEPHRSLERLKIDFFGGSRFPNWLGNPSFDKLENISLTNCNCTSLPHLGQLPMLKHLRIGSMLKVKYIGIDFFMDSYTLEQSFPSLETLRFECMPEWENWSFMIDNGESEMQFPRLYQLTMFKCPKLTKVSKVNLPLLRELDLEECNRVVLDSFMNMTSVTYLKLESVMGLTYLPTEFIQFAATLEVLEICNCNEVSRLWENGFSVQSLICLRRLVIADCSEMVSFAEEDDHQLLPLNLEILELFRCMNLTSLPSELSNLASLRELMIKYLPLENFPETGLPTTLRRLEIQGCNALKSLPSGMFGLERLEIKDCLLLKSWPTGNFPASLKKFAIKDSEHLEPVSMEVFQQNNRIHLEELNISNWENFGNLLQYMHKFSCLVELYISECDSLECFPGQSLPTPSLRILSIEKCSKLKSVQLQRISALVSLEVHSCQNLEAFPDGEFPSSLTKLRISDSRKLRPLQEWHLHKLNSLQEISIYGGFPKLDCFQDEYLFPSTVTKFSIARFPKLKSLHIGLDRLTSLQHLSVMNCPKLLVLPSEDLLDRLWHMEISGCPHMKQRCQREKGEYWSKISGIPCVEIDGSYVYKQSSD